MAHARSRRTLTVSLYIQMELCTETLEDYLTRDMERPDSDILSPEDYVERLEIASHIINALDAIHNDYHLIHRDLSLRNIFIGKDGLIKIGDFGLATKCKHLIPQLSSPATLKPMARIPEEEVGEFVLNEEESSEAKSQEYTHGLGTKLFAAPEQMADKPYDQKARL